MRRLLLPLGLAAVLSSPFPGVAQTPAPAVALPSAPVPAGPTQPAGILTLDAALALAEAGSFTLSAAGKELDATEGDLIQSRVLPNPELAVSMEDTRKASRSTTGQVNLPLELGGKRAARIGLAERGRELAQAELGSTRAELRAAVIARFFGVLVAQERVRLAEGSLGIAGQAADAAGRRVAAGKVAPLEATRARVEQANAELELAEATGALQTARQSLAALWGESVPRFAQAQGDLDALPSRPAPAALQAALADSPLLEASRLTAERSRAEVAVQRSRQYPDVTVSLGAKRDNEANRNMAVLGVAIPLPLFDRNQGNLYAALRRADRAQDAHAATRVRLQGELQQASTQLSVSRAAAQTLQASVLPAAEQAYAAASRGFEAGKFNFLDVLDAQRTLFQARIRYLDVLARTYDAAASIDRILGH
ncbi:TolC family protein [Cupriavidus taiwanensis]|uniref:Cobalt-zinc-cadmium resistance protein CzcC n=1 Tax=Cupriavidus taiwanensis TaxID=164546 RepID=A0A375HNR5_9BURK|nr:TolC family protein [Cupriavidus taiwanensis]SOY59425.1 Cation efflux system protein, heavy metal resistance [Cupriavidus taiwanensis]SOY59814.1 Cation efflux system protein, heavy metal resistance [Cupriavidus taiwanensis]SOY91854.1 Cation efflux system protein, heavy metal resistance [Cupriavidus taiwanensis]SOZ28580.1 Cation efflux system protein, heavy metal resistance [Cupriavidus taiwanensis]SOZ73516.1 Cation efflux system protein, heavy metal resistance [Cupriavidus taiwanensis]